MSEKVVLGVGSRVSHPAFGKGVIIRLHKVAYDVSFLTYGIKQVGKDYEGWEIIEAIPASEGLTFNDVE